MRVKNKRLNAFLYLIFLLTTLSAVSEISAQTSDCVRAMPERVVRKSVFPQTSFVLNRKKRTGTENVIFGNGDKLTIINAGCEYFYLNFRFETKRFSARRTDANYWYRRVIELIKQTEKGIDAPTIQMTDAVGALEKHLKENPEPAFETEIDYGGADIRTFILVNRVRKLGGRKVVVDFAFAVGPL